MTGSLKKGELTESIVKDYDISFSRSRKLTSLPRTMFYYKSQKDDTAVIEALQDLAFKHPTYRFRKLFAYLRRSNNTWNHKRVYRVYKLLKLNRKRKGKRRLPSRDKQPLAKQELINQSWSVDFK
jgi:putative transposase